MNWEVQLAEETLRSIASEATHAVCKRVPKGYSVMVVVARPDEVLGIGTNQERHNIVHFLRRVADLCRRGPITSRSSEPIHR